ncbi:GTP pyrophosphokinase [Alkalibacterium pelagium]|jgi:putative GTP pyrophosphokinase|uniref:Putative GTP pyrophosphokinase n=1 Tax=Alkalibacterium pelagium TaxID=426702 RepID=A0A1H7NF05_9LACT|nr:GTP pyrophosphokinase family protein [Alkalibacterium pelagium]GEN51346.1 GTP pyrophosphokinase [Alkalibacterium pelagium]SEL22034.1 putative GTP pyrophosphokinase [Alkalibacterium pelagium]
MDRDWELFLLPYKQTVDELKVKLRGLRNMYLLKQEHGPIEFVTGRVKPINSILLKSRTRKISLDKLETDMEDLAGIRIMCPFVEDIYDVVEMLKSRNDLKVLYEKDYVTHKKESGYRSYHLICEYPVQLIDEVKVVLVEIQIRTLAMNFWASIEHSLNYKYAGEYPTEINDRLQKAAESAFQLDEEMSTIRDEIKDIQSSFRFKKD